MSMPYGMSTLLERKYAILQQQADAGTDQAKATLQNAGTNAVAGQAAALLDRTKAGLMPAESAAGIGLTKAQTGLASEQAKYLGPEATSRILLNKSSANQNDMQTRAIYNNDVEEFGPGSADTTRAMTRARLKLPNIPTLRFSN